MGSVDAFAKMKDGESIVSATPNGAQILVLAASRIEPVEDRSYDNRLDFGTIEASSVWKTFEIDLADERAGGGHLGSITAGLGVPVVLAHWRENFSK